MPLLKTQRARDEISSKQRTLSVRERSALFLADGIRSRDELVHLLQGDIGMLQKLMSDGYLIPSEILGAMAAGMTDFAMSQSVPTPSYMAPVPPPSKDEIVDPASFLTRRDTGRLNEQAITHSVDNFEGKRSLATTRMFLFDIVERMFVRKMPELANHFRDQLREARDRQSMLEIAREIVSNVEEIAGPDRADGLSERLAMMLPSEQQSF